MCTTGFVYATCYFIFFNLYICQSNANKNLLCKPYWMSPAWGISGACRHLLVHIFFMHQQSDLKRVKACLPPVSNTFPTVLLACLISAAFHSAQRFFFGRTLWKCSDCFQSVFGYRLLHNMNVEWMLHVADHLFIVGWCISTSPQLPFKIFFHLDCIWMGERLNNCCSLSTGHKGYQRVIWGLRTQPGSLLLMSIRLTIAHLFSNCRKRNLLTPKGQARLCRNVPMAAWCRKLLPGSWS